MSVFVVGAFFPIGTAAVPVLFNAVLSQLLTLSGDPPNIIIGSSFEEIGFVDFIVHVLPGIFLFCVPVSLAVVIWIYRYYLTAKGMKTLDGDKLKAAYPIYDEPRLLIAGTVTFFVIMLFFLHPVHHKETAWIALIGAFVVSIVLVTSAASRRLGKPGRASHFYDASFETDHCVYQSS